MQDAYIGVSGCVSNRIGRDIVWSFLQKYWTKLVERLGEKSSFLTTFVEVSTRWIRRTIQFNSSRLDLPVGLCRRRHCQ